MASPLPVLAGPDALAELRSHGLRPDRVRVLAAASGGPKGLVLHGLDRVLFPWLLARRTPLHAVGSSIGSWRLACLAQPDPVAALERFADAYVAQRYPSKPPPAEVSRQSAGILDAILGRAGAGHLARHATLRAHVVTVRARHLVAREGRAQALALGVTAALNAVDRRALNASLERVVFDAIGEDGAPDRGPFAPWGALRTRHAPLLEANAKDALMASAAVPLVMEGVRDPVAAPKGVYRDGGMSDYHFGAEIDPDDGLALYPHFFPELAPGWFDKKLRWRRTRGLRRTIVIAPSPTFVAQLPLAKIPDRQDFARLDDDARIRVWRAVLDATRRMGDALAALLERDRLAMVARPLR